MRNKRPLRDIARFSAIRVYNATTPSPTRVTMDAVEEIKNRLDIVDIVSETVDLRRTGKNYIGFCPFHDNKRTPAFVVFPETGTWRCFGCNEGGDIFTFVMKREGWDFRQALEHLAERAGVTLEPRRTEDAAEREAHQRLYDLMEEAVAFYRHHLHTPAGKQALDYLHKRGLTDETIEAFGLGYAPHAWEAARKYFTGKGYTDDDLLAAGLLTQRDDGRIYDRFRHRVMFPIRDARGRAVGFGARTLDPDGIPKYLNSPQTEIFDKSRLLYGLDKAGKAIRQRDQVVIVEGYMDVIGLYQAGFPNAVSPMGVALNEGQLRTLKRYTRHMVLALDPDAAGIRATLRSMEVAREALREASGFRLDPQGLLRQESRLKADLRVALLPEGQDPDEIALADPAAWERILASAQPIILFVMHTLAAEMDLDDPKAKADLAEQVLPLIYEVANPIEQKTYLQKLSALLRVDEDTLLAWRPPQRRRKPVQRRTPARGASTAQRPTKAQTSAAAPSRTPALLASLSRQVLGLLLRAPHLRFRADRWLRAHEMQPLRAADFPAAPHRLLFEAVLAATEQEDREPQDDLVLRLPTELHAEAERCLAATAALNAEQYTPALLHALLRLRREQVNRALDELRFLLESAAEDETPLYQERLIEAIRHRGLLDRALKEGLHLPAAH